MMMFSYCWVGMDSDVWKSELFVSVSAKNANMDIHISIHFNMDVRWDDFSILTLFN
jgi:hypothetical protein